MKGIKSAIYFVQNPQEVSKWIEPLIGKSPFFSDDKFVGYHIGSYEMGFHYADEKTKDLIGNQVCYWETDNIEESIEKLQEMGATLYRGPLHLQEGGIICQMLTPFNFIIGLKEE